MRAFALYSIYYQTGIVDIIQNFYIQQPKNQFSYDEIFQHEANGTQCLWIPDLRYCLY